MIEALRMFHSNIRGNFAVMSAILLVPLLGAAGLAVDMSTIYFEKSGMQQVADSAALAGVSELGIAGRADGEIHAIVKNFVESNILAANGESSQSALLAVDAEISSDRTTLTVNLAYHWTPFFLHYLDKNSLPIRVRSAAKLAQAEPSCVVALNDKGAGQLAMSSNARLSADRCAIHVNSNAPDAIKAKKKAHLAAINIYIAGGYKGAAKIFHPLPTTDSPTIMDPLANRVAPRVGECDVRELKIKNEDIKLKPGTYCGGISVSGKSHVKLQPGIYIIKDGPLKIKGASILEGRNVGFYFTGKGAVVDTGGNSTVSLTAPKTGKLAGILFFEDRKSEPGQKFAIRSKNAQLMEGTIYLARGKLFVDKASKVGQNAHWTAIIAGNIEIGNGPDIRINSNYAGSEVPVPDGISGSSHSRLIQ